MAAKSTDIVKLFMKVQSGDAFEAPDVFIPISQGYSNAPDVEQLDRTVVSGTGSKLAPVVGRRFSNMTLPHELTGVDYSNSEVPYIDPVLQGVGMVGAFGLAIPGTVTAEINIGDQVDGVTSGASAIAVVPAKVGDTFIYVDNISGTFQAENLEVSSSAVGTASGTTVQESYEYTYVESKDIKNVSVRLEEDFQKTEGYNGNLTINIEAGASQIAVVNMSLQSKFNTDGGKDVFRRDIVSMTDTSSFVDKTPAVFDCARFEIDGVKDLVASGTFNLDFAAAVNPRPDVNQCDGVIGMRISERTPVLTFRIEQPENTQYEYYESMVGSSTSPVYYRYGDQQYNTTHFIIPAGKITAVNPVEENLISYVEFTVALTGTNNDDLKILLT